MTWTCKKREAEKKGKIITRSIKSVLVEDQRGEAEEVEPRDERKECEKKKGEKQKSESYPPDIGIHHTRSASNVKSM